MLGKDSGIKQDSFVRAARVAMGAPKTGAFED
jgi:hypothetical protein